MRNVERAKAGVCVFSLRVPQTYVDVVVFGGGADGAHLGTVGGEGVLGIFCCGGVSRGRLLYRLFPSTLITLVDLQLQYQVIGRREKKKEKEEGFTISKLGTPISKSPEKRRSARLSDLLLRSGRWLLRLRR